MEDYSLRFKTYLTKLEKRSTNSIVLFFSLCFSVFQYIYAKMNLRYSDFMHFYESVHNFLIGNWDHLFGFTLITNESILIFNYLPSTYLILFPFGIFSLEVSTIMWNATAFVLMLLNCYFIQKITFRLFTEKEKKYPILLSNILLFFFSISMTHIYDLNANQRNTLCVFLFLVFIDRYSKQQKMDACNIVCLNLIIGFYPYLIFFYIPMLFLPKFEWKQIVRVAGISIAMNWILLFTLPQFIEAFTYINERNEAWFSFSFFGILTNYIENKSLITYGYLLIQIMFFGIYAYKSIIQHKQINLLQLLFTDLLLTLFICRFLEDHHLLLFLFPILFLVINLINEQKIISMYNIILISAIFLFCIPIPDQVFITLGLSSMATWKRVAIYGIFVVYWARAGTPESGQARKNSHRFW